MGTTIFSNATDSDRDALRGALDAARMALSLPPTALPLEFGDPVSWRAPGFGLFFAYRGARSTGIEALVEPENTEKMDVLPVIASPAGASLLPTPLAPFNAFVRERFGDQWPVALADEVLARAWLHRRRRRVFVSYVRREASGLAHQLVDALRPRGFDVFLDLCDVATGEPFQSALKAWLADADMLVLLASPGLELSKWVMDELVFAELRTIGVLPLVWQTAGDGVRARVGSRGVEVAPDPSTGRIAESALLDVVATLHARRAQAIEGRLEDVLGAARDHYEMAGRNVVMAPRVGDLRVSGGGGSETWVRVLPFRPTVETLCTIRTSWAAEPDAPAHAATFHDEPEPSREPLRSLAELSDVARWPDAPERIEVVCYDPSKPGP